MNVLSATTIVFILLFTSTQCRSIVGLEEYDDMVEMSEPLTDIEEDSQPKSDNSDQDLTSTNPTITENVLADNSDTEPEDDTILGSSDAIGLEQDDDTVEMSDPLTDTDEDSQPKSDNSDQDLTSTNPTITENVLADNSDTEPEDDTILGSSDAIGLEQDDDTVEMSEPLTDTDEDSQPKSDNSDQDLTSTNPTITENVLADNSDTEPDDDTILGSSDAIGLEQDDDTVEMSEPLTDTDEDSQPKSDNSDQDLTSTNPTITENVLADNSDTEPDDDAILGSAVAHDKIDDSAIGLLKYDDMVDMSDLLTDIEEYSQFKSDNLAQDRTSTIPSTANILSHNSDIKTNDDAVIGSPAAHDKTDDSEMSLLMEIVLLLLKLFSNEETSPGSTIA